MSLTQTLQQARRIKRVSQLELSLRLGVSQRHISYVESARARPSRELLLAWMRELDAPLAVRNAALLHAGYAPAYSDGALTDSALAPAREALAQLLQEHNPLPALVLDADWNLIDLNQGAHWLCSVLMPELWPALSQAFATGQRVSMIDALIHPQGLCAKMRNAEVAAPALLAKLRAEAWVRPTLAPQAQALADSLHQHFNIKPDKTATHHYGDATPPVLSTVFDTPFGDLSFFSMFTTFGTPQDITLASLRVEHLFAADAGTRAVLGREVAPRSE
jgi:transcriptional regulator with XRE-family HTH domain